MGAKIREPLFFRIQPAWAEVFPPAQGWGCCPVGLLPGADLHPAVASLRASPGLHNKGTWVSRTHAAQGVRPQSRPPVPEWRKALPDRWPSVGCRLLRPSA
eukprot:s765_g3.t1